MRINKFVKQTPLIHSDFFSQKLGAQIYFKCENLQKTGSFKFRGACNKILKFKEENGHFPAKIVANSSGNHAVALAFLAQEFGIEALIFVEENASKFKVKKAQDLGAQIILTKNKKDTEILAEQKAKEGYLYIHSSNDADVMQGQGTACWEAMEQMGAETPDVIFAPCGGGGLIAGSYLAAQKLGKKPLIFAAEPLKANDTSISYRSGKIFEFDDTPQTIADGARTLRPSAVNFPYIQKLDGVFEIAEEQIEYWAKLLNEHLQMPVEPTAALSVAAAQQFVDEQKKNRQKIADLKILAILSGGNC